MSRLLTVGLNLGPTWGQTGTQLVPFFLSQQRKGNRINEGYGAAMGIESAFPNSKDLQGIGVAPAGFQSESNEVDVESYPFDRGTEFLTPNTVSYFCIGGYQTRLSPKEKLQRSLPACIGLYSVGQCKQLVSLLNSSEAQVSAPLDVTPRSVRHASERSPAHIGIKLFLRYTTK